MTQPDIAAVVERVNAALTCIQEAQTPADMISIWTYRDRVISDFRALISHQEAEIKRLEEERAAQWGLARDRGGDLDVTRAVILTLRGDLQSKDKEIANLQELLACALSGASVWETKAKEQIGLVKARDEEIRRLMAALDAYRRTPNWLRDFRTVAAVMSEIEVRSAALAGAEPDDASSHAGTRGATIQETKS